MNDSEPSTSWVESITRYLGEGICAADAAGIVRLVNPAAEALLDLSNQQLLGKPLVDCFPFQIVDSQSPITLRELVAETLSRQSVRRGSNGFLTPRNGWPIPVGYCCSPLLEQGISAGLVIVVYDLRPIRRAERAEQTARSNELMVQQLRLELDQLTELATAPGRVMASREPVEADRRSESVAELAELRLAYAAMVDRALEQQSFRVSHRVSESLRELAERLGQLHAGPRDVIELHAAVLELKRPILTVVRMKAFVEESRFVLLELMGNMVSYYRRQMQSPRPSTAYSQARDAQAPRDKPLLPSPSQSVGTDWNRTRESADE
ncbi:PAS domain-containing protein [Tuwongella immobilis]|uniref:PAS domain-containing protein n=1 Tax=Tuwongella immobilis TaxID=692036 RepID=A0A6C2YQZ1_9BACT|nr:PAS domain-containing protein [Tuwongella immobilis]VIP04070.1 chemotaxis protein : NarL subfamily OS=Synechocystis sp. (strain PCC 6803 / Kazusa) GN=sll0485 PE=4 SV=1: PAS [Tuwongella immobilis]VTS05507.1 chemotaxis protein : NarL subfamily OS=Synechocystis sp. (strain PCC 6803 / Kazusa) GN=sll0485 PE=4 SV=1: PAS [Tuwongella immobilis]